MTVIETEEYNVPAVMRNAIRRLTARQGVIGVIVCDLEGFTLDSNLKSEHSATISAHVITILDRVKDVTRVSEKRFDFGKLSAVLVELETKELYIVPDRAGFIIVILREK